MAGVGFINIRQQPVFHCLRYLGNALQRERAQNQRTHCPALAGLFFALNQGVLPDGATNECDRERQLVSQLVILVNAHSQPEHLGLKCLLLI